MIIERHDITNDELIIANSYLEVALVGQAIVKFIQLLASFKDFQMLVVLINHVIIDLIPLVILYIMFIIDLTGMLLVAQGSYQLPTSGDPPSSTDYPIFPKFL